MSNPPGIKPPGWRRPRGIGLEREESQAHSVGQFLGALHAAKERRKAKKGLVVESVKPTGSKSTRRTKDGRLRNVGSGKFVKDPLSNLKRSPPIVPWNKGKKTGPRRPSK